MTTSSETISLTVARRPHRRPRRRTVEQQSDGSEIARFDAQIDELPHGEPQRLHHNLAGAEDHIGIQQPVQAAGANRRRSRAARYFEREVLIAIRRVVRLRRLADPKR